MADKGTHTGGASICPLAPGVRRIALTKPGAGSPCLCDYTGKALLSSHVKSPTSLTVRIADRAGATIVPRFRGISGPQVIFKQ
jgi:hypothetical protein